MGGREERDRKRNWAFEASKSTFSDTPPIRLHLIIPTKELRTEHSDLRLCEGHSHSSYSKARRLPLLALESPVTCSPSIVFDSLLPSCSLESFWIQQIVLTCHLLFWKHFCNVLYLLYVKIPEVFLALLTWVFWFLNSIARHIQQTILHKSKQLWKVLKRS